MAGIAHLQCQAGQLEEALALIGLIQHHSSSYQETKDRVDELDAELRSGMSVEQVEAALASVPEDDLWAIIATVESELG